MTRSGKRDAARIIEIRFYLDKIYKDAYFSLLDCLAEPFPLLQLEQDDQIIQINGIDVRHHTPEQLLLIFEGLSINEPLPDDASESSTKDELLF